jgi:hypothetical protein
VSPCMWDCPPAVSSQLLSTAQACACSAVPPWLYYSTRPCRWEPCPPSHGTARHSLWSLCTRVPLHVGLPSSGACTCPATGELLGLSLVLHAGLLQRNMSPRCDMGVRAADRTLQNTSHTISVPRLMSRLFPHSYPSHDSYIVCLH